MRLWTPEMRIRMYQNITEEFGAFSGWETKTWPSTDREIKKEVIYFYTDLADVLGAESWKAIQTQVRYATADSIDTHSKYKLAAFMSNKYAAFSAGFINSSAMPSAAFIQSMSALVDPCLFGFESRSVYDPDHKTAKVVHIY